MFLKKKKKRILPAWQLLSVAQTSLWAKHHDYKLPEKKKKQHQKQTPKKKNLPFFNQQPVKQKKTKLEEKETNNFLMT